MRILELNHIDGCNCKVSIVSAYQAETRCKWPYRGVFRAALSKLNIAFLANSRPVQPFTSDSAVDSRQCH